MFIINQLIVEHKNNYRLSKLYLPTEQDQFCWVLEDEERGYGIKIKHRTALPRGVYHVAATFSNRFQRDMLQLYTHEADLSCRHGGIEFTGIRVHGGNTHEDTSGCPLVAFNHYGNGQVQGTAEAKLFTHIHPLIQLDETVLWIIS